MGTVDLQILYCFINDQSYGVCSYYVLCHSSVARQQCRTVCVRNSMSVVCRRKVTVALCLHTVMSKSRQFCFCSHHESGKRCYCISKFIASKFSANIVASSTCTVQELRVSHMYKAFVVAAAARHAVVVAAEVSVFIVC